MTKACGRCHREFPLEGYYPNSSKDGRHSICKECVKADRKRRHDAFTPEQREAWLQQQRRYFRDNRELFRTHARNVRERVLDAYGSACKCCGETTREFLGIDHVNNDGEKHRRELQGYGRAIYKWLAKEGYPQDGRFQLLCHNCNMAKGLYGGCPHQGPVPYRRHKDMKCNA